MLPSANIYNIHAKISSANIGVNDALGRVNFLGRSNLVGVDLVGVDLVDVDLVGVDLVGVDLDGVNLVGVDLDGVDLGGVDLGLELLTWQGFIHLRPNF